MAVLLYSVPQERENVERNKKITGSVCRSAEMEAIQEQSEQLEEDQVEHMNSNSRNKLVLNPPCRNKPANSRANANIISWFCWHFVSDLINVGKQRDLLTDDIDDLTEHDTSQFLLSSFQKAWNSYQQQQQQEQKQEQEQHYSHWLLIKTLMQCIGMCRFISCIIASYVICAAWLLGFLAMYRVLLNIEQQTATSTRDNSRMTTREAYFFGALFVVVILVQVVCSFITSYYTIYCIYMIHI